MVEIWKDIKGFEGIYQASNKGRIKHLYTDTFKHGRHYIIEERIEQPITWQSRYLRVDLISRANNKRRATYIHNIIAETFLGDRPDGYVIDHINGNYLDNSADNLRYVTQQENRNNPITIERNKEALQNYWKNISKENKDKHSKATQIGMQNGGSIKVSKANKGRIPVYKDNDYKRIKPEELETYINNGYIKGMPKWIFKKT